MENAYDVLDFLYQLNLYFHYEHRMKTQKSKSNLKENETKFLER